MPRRMSKKQASARSKFDVQDAKGRARPISGKGDQLFDNLNVEILLTAEQLATRLNVATWTIRKWRYERYLPPNTMIKLRSQVRYRWAEVMNWLSTRETL